jgi:hypothetical protein
VALAGVAFVLLSHALWDLHTGNLSSPYLMVMNWDLGTSAYSFIRIRAVGYLADPNDFAQFMLITFPLITLAWEKGKKLRNFFLVLVPCGLLVYGIYLTRSRGALLALTVLLILFMSKRVPLWVSVASGAGLFVAMKVFGFTGGRDVSVNAGSERIDLWGIGLHLFRTSPLWGVGYGKFGDFAFLTAHNSFILCLAEVGLIGYTCWLATIVIAFLQLNEMARVPVAAVPEEKKAEPEVSFHKRYARKEPVKLPFARKKIEERDATEDNERVRRWAVTLRFSLIAFLVTGWFLSRTYTVTLYVILGLTAALSQLAKESPRAEEKPEERPNWIWITAAAEVATIVVLYAIVRFQGLFVH